MPNTSENSGMRGAFPTFSNNSSLKLLEHHCLQTHHTKLLVSHLHILAIGSKAKNTDEHEKRQGYDVANDDDLNVAEFAFLCQSISGDLDVWMPCGMFEPKNMQLQG